MEENIKVENELELQTSFNTDSIDKLMEDCVIENAEEVNEDEN